MQIILRRLAVAGGRLKVSARKFKEKLQPLFLLLLRLYSTAAKADHFFQNLEWFNGSGWKETRA